MDHDEHDAKYQLVCANRLKLASSFKKRTHGAPLPKGLFGPGDTAPTSRDKHNAAYHRVRMVKGKRVICVMGHPRRGRIDRADLDAYINELAGTCNPFVNYQNEGN